MTVLPAIIFNHVHIIQWNGSPPPPPQLSVKYTLFPVNLIGWIQIGTLVWCIHSSTLATSAVVNIGILFHLQWQIPNFETKAPTSLSSTPSPHQKKKKGGGRDPLYLHKNTNPWFAGSCALPVSKGVEMYQLFMDLHFF